VSSSYKPDPHFFSVFLVQFFRDFHAFFWSILCCSQGSDDPHENSARFGIAKYESKNLKTSFYIFGYSTSTMYRNLAIFLKFWSTCGYRKSQKPHDFSTFTQI
jgi:hypothetical protein